jgi:periplasmic protein TonB
MVTLSKYPKLIKSLELQSRHDESTADLNNFSVNKLFFYSIGVIVSALLLIFLFVISNLSSEAIDKLADFAESIPFFDLKISEALIKDLRFPSPITNTIFASNLIFISFAVFDITRKEEMNSDGSKDLFKESSTISYIIHLLILIIILLTVFFSWHPKPKVQVSRIEFIPTQIPSKKAPPITNRRAEHNSIDQGKHDPNKPITPPTKAPGAPQLPPSKPIPQPKVEPPKPSPQALQEPKAAPSPALKPSPAPKPKMLVDAINPAKDTQQDLKPLPKLMDYSQSTTTTGTTSSSSSTPAPKSSSNSGTGSSDVVARLSSIPRAPDMMGSTGQGGAYGTPGNPGANPYGDRPPSIAAQADLNFGPYMSALQRAIKRSWKPPRGSESNRIVVTFTVLANGRLSDLRIIQESVDPEANLAALEAVTRAAPFDPLPNGAGSSVDIEFTFDYNVFQKTRW